jgi:hypothetical protein
LLQVAAVAVAVGETVAPFAQAAAVVLVVI